MGLRGEEHGDDGDGCHEDQVQRQCVRAVPGQEKRGDEGRRAARKDRRELCAERRAAVTHSRAEQLGEERCLRAVHRRVGEHERDDEREPHERRRPGVEQPEQRIRPQSRGDRRRTDTRAAARSDPTSHRRTESRSSSRPAPINIAVSTTCCGIFTCCVAYVRTKTL